MFTALLVFGDEPRCVVVLPVGQVEGRVERGVHGGFVLAGVVGATACRSLCHCRFPPPPLVSPPASSPCNTGYWLEGSVFLGAYQEVP